MSAPDVIVSASSATLMALPLPVGSWCVWVWWGSPDHTRAQDWCSVIYHSLLTVLFHIFQTVHLNHSHPGRGTLTVLQRSAYWGQAYKMAATIQFIFLKNLFIWRELLTLQLGDVQFERDALSLIGQQSEIQVLWDLGCSGYVYLWNKISFQCSGVINICALLQTWQISSSIKCHHPHLQPY